MSYYRLNRAAIPNCLRIGAEQIPVLIIDNFFEHTKPLIDLATDEQEHEFSAQLDNYYPGIRKPMVGDYADQICQHYSAIISARYAFNPEQTQAHPLMSAFAITSTPANQLTPIQMVPHFDSTDVQQFAIVHYLCSATHGGTAFYRHRSSGFETINDERLVPYGSELKQQAIAAQLHKQPGYIDGNSELFEQIHCVSAAMNRAIIYPSNLLHSGHINTEQGLSADPKRGRLTVSTFISFRAC